MSYQITISGIASREVAEVMADTLRKSNMPDTMTVAIVEVDDDRQPGETISTYPVDKPDPLDIDPLEVQRRAHPEIGEL